MAATAGPSCGEQGPKFSKQELSCSSGVHHEIIGWENWIVQTPTCFVIHKKIRNDNWTKLDRVNRPLHLLDNESIQYLFVAKKVII